MKHKRHLIILNILIIYCLFIVSCNSLNTNSYKIEILLNEANSSAKNNNFDDSITKYNLILDIDNFNQKALYNKSLILFEDKKIDEALQTIEILIEKYPNNIKGYKLKADIYLYNNDIENMLKIYNSLFKTYPNLYNLRSDLIKILIENYKNDSIIISNLYDNAIILIENNENTQIASEALYILNKNNIDYSLLLYLNDKKAWEEYNTPSLEN